MIDDPKDRSPSSGSPDEDATVAYGRAGGRGGDPDGGPERPRRTAGRIGSFELLEELGEGGMGTVYRAEQQEPIHRVVALKVMRSSLPGPTARARFDMERQALARLSHPNIAAMYEAGTTQEGFPYFVMELVEGVPITKDADRRRLSLRERVELFAQVCRGVEHAHRKGIIHRDIKPSNVLVCEVEGRPVPKIIDFGIAKSVDAPGEGVTRDSLVGTPAYMSPEALGLGIEDLDTRADIYSLGVLLHELLAQLRPFDTDGMGLAAIAREITESDAEPLPARFRALAPRDQVKAAEARRTDPASLAKHLSGDLDAIVHKATRLLVDERYGSAAEFAEDLERYLQNRPVLAAPPELRVRLRKFARRHRAVVAAGFLVLLSILGAVAGITRAMIRERKAHAESQRVADFLADLLEKANPWQRGREVTVRELLEEASRRIPVELRDQPRVQAELLSSIGTTQFHLRHLDLAEKLLREALRLREEVDGPENPETASAQNDLAMVLYERGTALQESEDLLRQSLVIRRKTSGELNSRVARGLFDLAVVLERRGKLAEAEASFRESLRLREALYARHDPHVVLGSVALSTAGLGNFLGRNGRPEEGEAYLRRSLALWREGDGVGYAYAWNQVSLGRLLIQERRYPEAEATARESLATLERFLDKDDMRIAHAAALVAVALREQGRAAEAQPFQDRAMAIAKAALAVGDQEGDEVLDYLNQSRRKARG